MSTENIATDELDKKIIGIMQEDASLTNNDIAKKINLSPSATHERIKKLHTSGVIKKIVAFIQAEAIERALCAYIYVLVDTPQNNEVFLHDIVMQPSVMECHHITGEYSYLLKVRVKNTQGLESFITKILKTRFGIVRTLTQIVLSSPKDGDTVVD